MPPMSHARRLWIEGPAGKLEAALRIAPDPRACIVLAHPHPLYGGTLHNPVIFHADRELNQRGLTTLRFNFRGVEGSEGVHDEGRGEVGDVAAACAWIQPLTSGKPLIVLGYSFGSRCVILHASADKTIAGVVAIGLPVRLWPFDEIATLGRPLAVVQGTEDEYGSIAEVEAVISNATPKGKLYTVPGASHLFPGRAPRAGALVADAVEGMLSD